MTQSEHKASLPAEVWSGFSPADLKKLEDEERQNWGTPKDAVANLPALLGEQWRVTLDVCAQSWSAKAPHYFGPGGVVEDALAGGDVRDAARLWHAHSLDGTAFCNMPFEHIDPWVEVAITMVASFGGRVMVWCPSRTGRPWWTKLRRCSRARDVTIEGRVEHEVPPRLAEAYARTGKRRTGNGGDNTIWCLSRVASELPRRDMVIMRDELMAPPAFAF